MIAAPSAASSSRSQFGLLACERISSALLTTALNALITWWPTAAERCPSSLSRSASSSSSPRPTGHDHLVKLFSLGTGTAGQELSLARDVRETAGFRSRPRHRSIDRGRERARQRGPGSDRCVTVSWRQADSTSKPGAGPCGSPRRLRGVPRRLSDDPGLGPVGQVADIAAFAELGDQDQDLTSGQVDVQRSRAGRGRSWEPT